MTAVTITTGDEWATVAFRYDADLVAMVKSIHWQSRNYDGATKLWRVHESAIEMLVEMIVNAGHSVDTVDGAIMADGDRAGMRKQFHQPAAQSLDQFFDENNGYDVTGAAIAALDRIPAQHQHAVWRHMGKILLPDMYDRTAMR